MQNDKLDEHTCALLLKFGGFGGGSSGLCCDCCESDLKNISRFDCN